MAKRGWAAKTGFQTRILYLRFFPSAKAQNAPFEGFFSSALFRTDYCFSPIILALFWTNISDRSKNQRLWEAGIKPIVITNNNRRNFQKEVRIMEHVRALIIKLLMISVITLVVLSMIGGISPANAIYIA